MPRSSRAIVLMSASCGTLSTRSGSALNRPAARIGRAAFFAPAIRTSPVSGRPPAIFSLSMGSGAATGRRR